jgi:PhnB protein
MSKAILFDFKVDASTNTIRVDRSFNAPIDLVWAAWTEPDILEQWWAPKPYKAVVASMDFRVGGRMLYYMLSPEGDKHWCLFDYETINPLKSYSGMDAFCDENGGVNSNHPRLHWTNTFEDKGDETVVHVLIKFDSYKDIEAIIQMGFKEGFTMGLQNLDEYISAQFYLRAQKKPNNQPRVSTYVNFPGNTEEAFLFYRSVFKTEFIQGMQRFRDIPPSPDAPNLPENIKDMILHVELPMLGGHVLMGTDAPKEMGFELISGNNMHINLEPSSREETDRIFHALSEGGNVTMPLMDMFFGAYYGSCTDKYGINWMVHCRDK